VPIIRWHADAGGYHVPTERRESRGDYAVKPILRSFQRGECPIQVFGPDDNEAAAARLMRRLQDNLTELLRTPQEAR
jgi:hypothetical protein